MSNFRDFCLGFESDHDRRPNAKDIYEQLATITEAHEKLIAHHADTVTELAKLRRERDAVLSAMHYPECWDTIQHAGTRLHIQLYRTRYTSGLPALMLSTKIQTV